VLPNLTQWVWWLGVGYCMMLLWLACWLDWPHKAQWSQLLLVLIGPLQPSRCGLLHCISWYSCSIAFCAAWLQSCSPTRWSVGAAAVRGGNVTLQHGVPIATLSLH